MNYRKLILSLVILFLFIAAKSDLQKEFTFKNFEKTLAKIDAKLYASKYEVTNLQYTTFLKDLKSQGKIQEYAIANIDSLGWQKKNAYNEPYVELYHTHPAYPELFTAFIEKYYKT